MAASTNSHELYSLGPTQTNSTPEAYLPGTGWPINCVVYACKTFLRVLNGDVASQQGVLGGSWTRLGSEARWTNQMPCSRVAIADWLERGQRSAAAFVGRQTRGRRDLVDGNWTRLVREARWTKSDESQMPCGRVAIGLKGASVQRSAAAFVGTRERQTRGRCNLDARTRAFTYDHCHRRPECPRRRRLGG